MESLVLCYRGEPLREFALEDRPLWVGKAAGCDIVVHDTELPPYALWVLPEGGRVTVHELHGLRRRPRPFPMGEALTLGRAHTLVRMPKVPGPEDPTTTEPLARSETAFGGLALVVGYGREARRVALPGRPFTIGSSPHNDLVLTDRAVSGRHAVIAWAGKAMSIRDLNSKNGTFLDGLRVQSALAAPGSKLRVGRTDLTLIEPGRRGDARGEGIVAVSDAMLRVLATVERYARLPWTTLITGESGVGKEGVARALHARGRRDKQPFVAVNAGAINRSLIESELFGHERGAFTGATASHRGMFEQAHGGTLFLDEIGELPLDLQARLLRVLEGGEVRKLGGEQVSAVDVRLVCATHADLRAMVRSGRFRQDLYYRIARLVIDVPPLRSRPDDLEPLAEHFLRLAASELGARRLTSKGLEALLGYTWPGNVRELRNVVLAAAVCSASGEIGGDEVGSAIAAIGAGGPSPTSVEADRIFAVLERHQGNVTAAARALGVPRSTLRDRLRSAREKKTESSEVDVEP